MWKVNDETFDDFDDLKIYIFDNEEETWDNFKREYEREFYLKLDGDYYSLFEIAINLANNCEDYYINEKLYEWYRDYQWDTFCYYHRSDLENLEDGESCEVFGMTVTYYEDDEDVVENWDSMED